MQNRPRNYLATIEAATIRNHPQPACNGPATIRNHRKTTLRNHRNQCLEGTVVVAGRAAEQLPLIGSKPVQSIRTPAWQGLDEWHAPATCGVARGLE